MDANPHVCCILLTADRQELTDRAVRCFMNQTYANRSLLIFDSGRVPYQCAIASPLIVRGIKQLTEEQRRPKVTTIGKLRNMANALAVIIAPQMPDLFAHWDSDDWSSPDRLAMQVPTLSDDVQVTGLSRMVFWQSGHDGGCPAIADDESDEVLADYKQCACNHNTAWYYRHRNPYYCIGTSLVYHRDAWLKKAFAETSSGEDSKWSEGQKARALHGYFTGDIGPLMIAEVHGGNTVCRIHPDSEEFTRFADIDERVRELMGTKE